MYREAHAPEEPVDAQEVANDGFFPVILSLPRKRVALGAVFATPAALQRINWANVSPADLLRRHALGDWGDVPDEDWKRNDRAALQGERILSAYQLPTYETICIVTECDRSTTTLILPEEY